MRKNERRLSMNRGSGAGVPPAAGASRPRIRRGRDAREDSRDGCPTTAPSLFMVPMGFSLLREQVFQIVLGQAARETFLAQHVADGLGLALLEFPDFFLDGSRADESVGIDGAGLADAMRAIDGLGFDGRVPPGIIEHDVTGGGEVQAGARGAETEEEDSGIGIVLEGVDDFLAVFGLASEDM